MKTSEILSKKLSPENRRKLDLLGSERVTRFIGRFVEKLAPETVFVCDDSPADMDFIRREALERGEERPLAVEGHTIHFDGYHDQARDKERTKFLLGEGESLGANINAMERERGLREIGEIMKGIMRGRTLYVLFFSLGPPGSRFTIPALQLTDSAYVAHSESLLYRPGFEEFRRGSAGEDFFKFVHSAGELDERMASRNVALRRIYIDCREGIIYSANTQYGGNTLGLKKLAMRLAIRRASREGWLTEHMFLMGVRGPRGRVTYFAGAFPSMCGKTSTAMVEGESIVGDDIVYIREVGGRARAVNVERGMFGIIQGVNSRDDPIIWRVLNTSGEVIFSNVLLTPGGGVYWTGKDGPVPARGFNYSGEWYRGKKDERGAEVPPSHKNARFTIRLEALENVDPRRDDPEGVELGGIIYGGRDSDTWVPVQQSFGWDHGVITMGAALESETTAATLGREGMRAFNPMSNLDFLSIPLGDYVRNCLAFASKLSPPPEVFSVNYFLRGPDGEFLNEKVHKKVWLKWMERRVHGGADAVRTPTGFIPRYGDLRALFDEVLGERYTREAYEAQFTIRIPENLSKTERILGIYGEVEGAPREVVDVLEAQRGRLLAARRRCGDYVSPAAFA